MSKLGDAAEDADTRDVLARRRIGAVSYGHGGGGGGSDDMEPRVAALEKGFEKLNDKLDALTNLIRDFRLETEKRFGAIEGRLTGIEKTLDAKASVADVRELNGKVSGIPNTWQTLAIMAGLLVGVSGLAFTIAKWAHP